MWLTIVQSLNAPYNTLQIVVTIILWEKTRVGHAFAEYAVHADYAHMGQFLQDGENV